MNIHMYHRFSHVDLRGMYNGFLIPLWPRAAPQACGLSAGFNGLRWIILVGLFSPSDMNKTSISSLWGYFSPFVCCLLLAYLVVIACARVCVCVVCARVCLRDIQSPLAPLWKTSKSWSLTPPSHFRQIKVWKVSPEAISPSSGWVKNVYEGCVSYYL